MKAKFVSEYEYLMEQWDFERNEGIDPYSTPAGKKMRVWWICHKCGHRWEAFISTRKESSGNCPVCEKKQKGPPIETYICDVPFLIDSWGDNPGLDPSRISASKNLNAKWKCADCGYEWSANIHSRYYDKTGCPACNGKIATEKRNALVMYPELAYYYDDEAPDNPPLESLLPTSSVVVKWRCPDCGYKWSQPLVDRAKNGKVRGCAICTKVLLLGNYTDEYPEAAEMYSSKNTTPFSELNSYDRNNEYLWECSECGYEFKSTLGSMMKISKKPHKGCPKCLGKVVAPDGESAADLFPELLEEVNDDTDLYSLLPGSEKEVLWKCKTCGYEWSASVVLRTKGYKKCAVCNNAHPVKGYNTVLDVFLDVAKRWSSSNNKKPDELLPSSADWVRLICPDCGMEHSVQVREATKGNIVCPYCSGAKPIPDETSLEALYPQLMDQWDYEMNSTLPCNVSPKSHQRYYWVCAKGHSYYLSPNDMVIYTENDLETCPYCSGRIVIPDETSFAAHYPDLAEMWDYEKNMNANGPDCIREKSTASYWWRCGQGHSFIRSPYQMLEDIEAGKISCPFCDVRRAKPEENSFAALHSDLAEMWDYDKNTDAKGPDYIREKSRVSFWWVCEEGHSFRRTPAQLLEDIKTGTISCPFCDGRRWMPGKTSLAALHPDLAEMWDYDKNTGMEGPDYIRETSQGYYWWVCEEGHSFRRSPAQLVEDIKTGTISCPYCDGRRVIPGKNSFAALHSDLAEMWDYDKNTGMEGPDYIRETSPASYWWKCSEGHSFRRSPAQLLEDIETGTISCPYCDDRKAIPGKNSFAALHPDLAEMWDYDKNTGMEGPDYIRETSQGYYWWVCEEGHSFRRSPAQLLEDIETGTISCPYCDGRRVIPGLTSFKAKYPDLMEEWDELSNYALVDPDAISEKAQDMAWWKCPKGHQYPMKVYQRVKFDYRGIPACPVCKGKNRNRSHFYMRKK